MRPLLFVDHGGLKLRKRKTARPLDLDRPVLLVFRSDLAKGVWSLSQPYNKKRIQRLLGFYAARFSIKVVKTANFGLQFQIIVKAKSRQSLQNFLRGFAGTLALEITGAKRGVKYGRFWSSLVFSRVLLSAKGVRHAITSLMVGVIEFNFPKDQLQFASLRL